MSVKNIVITYAMVENLYIIQIDFLSVIERSVMEFV